MISQANEPTEEREEEDITVWHRRMAHLGVGDVKKLEKFAVGVRIAKDSELGVCGNCLAGKQYRTPSHEPTIRSMTPGELIHSDMSGKIDPPAIGGYNYYGLFINDATRMTYFAPMKTNGSKEMLTHFQTFRKLIQNELDTKVKCFRTDNGSEYKLHMENYLKQEGIKYELTAAYHLDQNSVAERANRTIM